jgi:hypothetical protein
MSYSDAARDERSIASADRIFDQRAIQAVEAISQPGLAFDRNGGFCAGLNRKPTDWSCRENDFSND